MDNNVPNQVTPSVPNTPIEKPTVENSPVTPNRDYSAFAQIPPLPEKKLPKYLIFLLVFAIFTVIGISAYLSYKSQKKSYMESPVVAQKATPSDKNESPTPTSIPNENWMTHTSPDFTVKYPEDLVLGIGERSLEMSKLGPTQKENTEFFDVLAVGFHPIDSEGKTPEEYAEELIEESETLGINKITKGPIPFELNGYEGVTFTEEGQGTFETIVLSSKDGKTLIRISIMVADPGNLEFQEEVNNILSTFTFSE